jgi:ribosomal protein L29
MKIKDIINKTPADLNQLVATKRETLRTFRFGTAGAKTKNVKEGRTIRKEIAQILTVLNQKKNA